MYYNYFFKEISNNSDEIITFLQQFFNIYKKYYPLVKVKLMHRYSGKPFMVILGYMKLHINIRAQAKAEFEKIMRILFEEESLLKITKLCMDNKPDIAIALPNSYLTTIEEYITNLVLALKKHMEHIK